MADTYFSLDNLFRDMQEHMSRHDHEVLGYDDPNQEIVGFGCGADCDLYKAAWRIKLLDLHQVPGNRESTWYQEMQTSAGRVALAHKLNNQLRSGRPFPTFGAETPSRFDREEPI
jgi:hypothetical protein